MRPHENLEVWKESINFVIDIYKLTAQLPDYEKFGLISQLNRAAVSIPSNIAEGAARSGKKEFINFLYIAQGSAAEIETQLIISNKLGYLKQIELESLLKKLDSISKMITGLKNSVNQKK